MYLILCPSNDQAAYWAYQGLHARGLAPLEFITAEALIASPRWEHRVHDGGVTLDVTLPDGRRLDHNTLQGVLNRIAYLPPDYFAHARPEDRTYASQEFTAFFMSWLQGLPCPVLNRSTPQGLCGSWRHASEWTLLAAQAGLPTPPYRQTGHDVLDGPATQGRLVPHGTPVQTVFVVGARAGGTDAPDDILEGCCRLAHLSGNELLGVEFALGVTGPWTFAGATPWPNLRLGGEELLNALATTLTQGQEIVT